MPGILVATHGGRSADGAVRVAAGLAARLGTGLGAVSVIEPQPLIDAGAGVPYIGVPEDDESLVRGARQAVAAQLARCGVAAGLETRVGPAAQEIASAARMAGAELIVLGIGPHALLDRAMGHETALQLVQSASTPVLAVAADATAVPSQAIAAVDFSANSILSARTIARWMRAGDTLVLAHVTHVPHAASEHTPATEALSAHLDALAAELVVAEGVSVRTVVLAGEPAPTLLDLASRLRADLIATGSHGHGFWKRLTLGSVASRIVRLSTRSVLVTPIGSVGARQLAPAGGAQRAEAVSAPAAASAHVS